MKKPEKKELATTGERVVYVVSRVVDWVYIIFFLVVLLFCIYVIYDSAMVYEEASNSGIVKEFVLEDDDGARKIDFEVSWLSIKTSWVGSSLMVQMLVKWLCTVTIIPFIFRTAMIKNTP